VSSTAPAARQQAPPSDAMLIGAITIALLADLPPASLAAALGGVLVPAGIAAGVVAEVAGLVATPVNMRLAGGPASIYTAASEPSRRAAYILAASRRVEAGGTIDAERTFMRQHLQAARARAGAALDVDAAVTANGTLLGWRSRRDAHVDPICARLDGTNFDVTRPPGGYPGQLHGGTCRCSAVAPFGANSRREPAGAGLRGGAGRLG